MCEAADEGEAAAEGAAAEPAAAAAAAAATPAPGGGLGGLSMDGSGDQPFFYIDAYEDAEKRPGVCVCREYMCV